MPNSLCNFAERARPDSGNLSGRGLLANRFEIAFCQRPVFGTIVKSIIKPREAVDAKELFAWILERTNELLGMGRSSPSD